MVLYIHVTEWQLYGAPAGDGYSPEALGVMGVSHWIIRWYEASSGRCKVPTTTCSTLKEWSLVMVNFIYTVYIYIYSDYSKFTLSRYFTILHILENISWLQIGFGVGFNISVFTGKHIGLFIKTMFCHYLSFEREFFSFKNVFNV